MEIMGLRISGKYWCTAAMLCLCLQLPAQDTDSLLVEPPLTAEKEYQTLEQAAKESASDALPMPTLPAVPDTLMNHLLKDEKLAYLQRADSLMRELDRQRQQLPDDVKADDIDISFEWVRPLLWTLAILALAYLLYMITLGRGRLFAPANANTTDSANQTDHEELEETDPDKKALAAIARQQYRPAVRYLFIDTLNKLDERSLINKAPRKTNIDYLHEIENEQCKQELAELMLRFEYVWYGQFTPSQPQFEQIHQRFQKFHVQWCS